jgi:hypothetical protein
MPLDAMRRPFLALALVSLPWLGGCDLLGIESPAAVAATREAESKAIGAGCRHAARSVEACFGLNKRADKAAVFAGWREMNDYMRENKIEAMPATAAAAEADGAAAAPEEEQGAGKGPKLAEAGKSGNAESSDKGQQGNKGDKGDKSPKSH